ncbi:MAG: ScyD/ScyE family protein [Lysobacter sp.]|nr:ScyD/ScyE family protein [Lysobacter sp.]
MSTPRSLLAGALALGTALACSASFAGASAPPASLTPEAIASLVQPQAAQAVTVSVFATGLYNPRGLKFGPDGYLYVAEGGKGGTHSTVGQCTQVVAPVGPYTGSYTGGRISRISAHGVRTTVTSQLPSSQTSPALGSLISGVADVAFVDGKLYALMSGAGCSHGVRGRDNAVVRIHSDGSLSLVADLSTFIKSHPVMNPEPDDFEPDGTWWGLVAAGGYLFATEPNHGELDRIDPRTGAVHRVADISATQGHIVPTALTAFYGHLFVGNLGTFPVAAGASKIMRISPITGQLSTVVTGLTTVLGVQFDSRGRMYALQTTDGSNPNPVPGTGSIVRIVNGAPETIVSGLTTPTGMAFGPDGDLYVSNVGFGAPPMGLGQVLRIHLGQ